MSPLEALVARVAPQVEPEAPSRAAHLRPVPAPRPQRMAKVPFVLFLGLVLGLGMVGLVVLNTTIQSQAAELGQLQGQATRLGNEQALLQGQVQELRSSVHLEQAAQELGMRPNPYPAFIVLPQGTVLGKPVRVTGNEMPDQRYRGWDQVQQGQEAARARVAAEARAREEARARKLAEERKKAAAAAAKAKAAAAKAKAAAAKAEADAKKKAAAVKPNNAAPSPKAPAPTKQPTTTGGN